MNRGVPMTPPRQVIESLAQKLHQSIVEMTMALKREHMTTPSSAAFDLACKEFREKERRPNRNVERVHRVRPT